MNGQTRSRAAYTDSSLRLIRTMTMAFRAFEIADEATDILRDLLPDDPTNKSEARVKQRLRFYPFGGEGSSSLVGNPGEDRFYELILTRVADHLVAYLTDVATEILGDDPGRLDGLAMPVEGNHDEDAARLAAERFVLGMSLDPLGDGMGRFARLFGLEFEFASGLLEVVGELVERRRVLAYGHGMVDRRYIERTGSELHIGERVSIDRDYMWNSLARVKTFVAAIDDAVCARFPELRMADPEMEVIVPRQFQCATDEPAD